MNYSQRYLKHHSTVDTFMNKYWDVIVGVALLTVAFLALK